MEGNSRCSSQGKMSYLLNSTQTNQSHNSSYLENTLVCGMLLQLNQTIENNQLYVVVALLNNQINVALGSSLESDKAHDRLDCARLKTLLMSDQL